MAPTTNTPVPTPQTSEQGYQNQAPPAQPTAPDVQPTDSSAPALPVAPAATPAAPPNPDAQKHSMIGQIFQTIAGGQKTVYDQTAQGPIPRKVDLKPGEVARTILASAFSLMAAGAAGAQGKSIPHDITIGGMRESRDEQAEQQAQQQFQNKQVADRAAREADEQTLAHARDAREQQKAIQDAKAFDMNMQVEAASLSHLNVQRSLDMAKYLNEQAVQMEVDNKLGIKIATIAGQPTPTFSTGAAMQDFATKNASALTQNGFNVQPRWEMNPDGTLVGHLVEVPRAQGPIPVGFKLGKDGQPVLDSFGNRVPDGTIKGPDGKPTGFMAPDMTSAMTIMKDQAQLKLTSAQIEDVRAQIQERLATHAKDAVYQKALEDFTKNNGDPSMMNPGNRIALLEKTTIDYMDAGKTLGALQASGAPDDVIALATQNFNQISRMRLELSTQTNLGVLTVKQMQRDARQKGKDLTDDAALKAIDQSNGLTKGDKAQAREFVLGGFTVDNINEMDKFQKQDIGKKLATLGLQKGTALIQSSTLSDADKQTLITGLQKNLSGQTATTPSQSNVPAGMTRMSDGQLIPNDSVQSFLQKYPTITVAEKGPLTQPTSAQEIPYAPK